MKNQLSKKVSAFIFPIAIWMMFSASANAQIIYTDVNPDTTFNSPSGSYSLDINQDGITDNVIRTRNFLGRCSGTASGIYSMVTVYTNTNIGMFTNGVVSNSAKDHIIPLNFNDLISSSQSFTYYTLDLLRILTGQTCNGTFGSWPNLSEKYLGLRFKVGVNTYYGWVRMQINVTSSSASCTIKDYAYNSIPNQPILAGETSCTIPTVNLTQSGPLSFCNGDSVTLTANGTGYKYQWKKNGVNIAGATAKTYSAKTAGIYKCKVTNSCGSKTSGGKTVTVPCRNTDASILSMTSNELEHLSVYPNPATNAVTIKFPSDEAGEIQVVNLFGQIVYSEKVNAEQTQIDVSSFAAGMYVIRWNSGENFETKIFSVTK